MRRDPERIYDEYLVAAARAGDKRAFERLAGRFQPKLLAHAWRLTDDAEMTKEAVQDGWVEIIRGLPRLYDTVAFPAWAYRIITRCCAKTIRRSQRRRRIKNAVAAETVAVADTIDGAERQCDAQTITAAIAALPQDQRAAMALYYLEDLSVAEIAVALDVPAGTVKTRLMHARRKVRTALQGDDDA